MDMPGERWKPRGAPTRSWTCQERDGNPEEHPLDHGHARREMESPEEHSLDHGHARREMESPEEHPLEDGHARREMETQRSTH